MQGDKNWLLERKKGIGSTDVSSILGLNKYKTAYDVYIEKTSEDLIQVEENIKMKRGKQMEDTIAKMYAEETGAIISTPPEIIWSTEIPYFFASLDRFVEINGEQGILEIKNTTSKTSDKWEDGIPDHYLCQIQHQLFVTKLPFCVFCYLVDGWDLKYNFVYPNENYLKLQNEILINFWENNILKKYPPEAQSEADLYKLYPETKKNNIEITEESYNTIQRIISLKEKIKELEDELEVAELSIKLLMKDNETATYQGQPVCSYRYVKPFYSFNSKSFKENNPELYSQYLGLSKPSRRLYIKN